jgi:hypothetical protein
LRASHAYLRCSIVCPSVRPSPRAAPRGAVYRCLLHIPQLAVPGSCKPRASHVHPSVRPAAVDLARFNRLDRTPIPAVCNFYTIAKRIHVSHNTVYNTRTKLISSTCQGPSSLQPALQSPCSKLINWQLAHV